MSVLENDLKSTDDGGRCGRISSGLRTTDYFPPCLNITIFLEGSRFMVLRISLSAALHIYL